MKRRYWIFLLIISMLLVGCQNKFKGIEGNWLLDDNSVMIIKENEFYWYQSKDNLKDNYFYGDNLKILQGEDAINAIQVPAENKEKLLKTHIYYLNTIYTAYHLNGQDISNQLDKKPSEFALQLNSKDILSIINLNTNASYIASRLEN